MAAPILNHITRAVPKTRTTISIASPIQNNHPKIQPFYTQSTVTIISTKSAEEKKKRKKASDQTDARAEPVHWSLSPSIPTPVTQKLSTTPAGCCKENKTEKKR
jgi:hypothetical protein